MRGRLICEYTLYSVYMKELGAGGGTVIWWMLVVDPGGEAVLVVYCGKGMVVGGGEGGW